MSQLTPREWLGLEATHNPNRWYLPVIPRLSVREIFLFGGAGLAAATTALEETPRLFHFCALLLCLRHERRSFFERSSQFRGHSVKVFIIITFGTFG